ncbi:hypothetical protein [Segatella paludivivens]|uniref:hypothetical protein n=1 Tax=Segatella paludivivens TaxID=185294 RepID=UPI0012B5F8C3|nr:hypothetical protein [Segatella paludivivens]
MPSHITVNRPEIEVIRPTDIEYVADITNIANDIYDIMHIRKLVLNICPSMFNSTACGTIVKSNMATIKMITSNDARRIANLCRISICSLMPSSPDVTKHP